jgi:hypothetical protein
MFCEIARLSITQPWTFVYLTAMFEHIARSGNIAELSYRRIFYSGDSVKTSFGDDKTNQEGQDSSYERAFFDNPNLPGSTFVFAMSMNVLCTDRLPLDDAEKRVFGGNANKSFEAWLATVKGRLTPQQLAVLGTAVEDIGIHGFRKSAFTFAGNAVDGAPPAAVEIRGCHAQEGVKEM